MGAKSQLKILLGGAQSWNAWRQANPDVPIDFDGEDLGQASLGIDDQASLALSRSVTTPGVSSG
jgi:hypothetical protein